MSEKSSKLWVHLVWSTKDNLPLLTTELRRNLIKHTIDVSAARSYYIACLNGGDEHLHCLLSYEPETSVLSILNEIGKEMLQWLNSRKNNEIKFSWNKDFAAFSVSESKVAEVKRFIAKQEEHHRHLSFSREWKALLKKHGV